MSKVWKEFFRLKFEEIGEFIGDIFYVAKWVIGIIYAATSVTILVLWIIGEVQGTVNFIFAVQPLIWVTVLLIFISKWFISWIASNWQEAKDNVGETEPEPLNYASRRVIEMSERHENTQKEIAKNRFDVVFSEDGIKKYISSDFYNGYLQHKLNKYLDMFIEHHIVFNEDELEELSDSVNRLGVGK